MKTNGVSYVLRIEAAAALLASVLAFHSMGGSWMWFAALFLLPDLSMLGYFLGPRPGAALYNTAHNYAVPAVVAGIAWLTFGFSPLWLIWFAHIAFDRLLGYGLKLDAGFRHTHLGLIGK